MDFFVLGPVEARTDHQLVNLGRRRERLLLGVLLLDAGKTISIDRLVDLLWDDPTPAARANLHSHVARLRSILATHDVRITTQAGGYRIEVDPATVDAHRFRRHVERARQLTDPQRRADLLGHALSLWRGPLLADVTDDQLRARIGAELAELRLVAIEARAAAELECGRPGAIIGDLTTLAAEHPTRERLTALLMLALHRDGRQAEALEAYTRTRETLAEDLGLTPGTELRALQQQILRDDPSLAVPAVQSPVGHSRRFLPHDVPDFTGRRGELAQLDTLTGGGNGPVLAPNIVITAIAGTAGVGKTALAVHWGHRVSDRFPDGQFYVDLRGYEERRPATPIDALAGLLRTLGVAPERVPTALDEASALFRSLVAEQKVLILLDNARSASQVRPLLPASPSAVVLVTSRDSLSGLMARDGARRLDLATMSPTESLDLIARIVGEQRAADRPAMVDLADFCGHLPLALRIAAASLLDRPTTTLRQLVIELRERDRLAALEIPDDPQSSVRAAFDHSVAALPESARSVFVRLSLTASGQFGAEAVAALCDISVERATSHLYRLAEVHLVQEASPGRYTLHDLVRAYVDDRRKRTEDAADTRAAVDRLNRWYLGTCAAAANLLYPQMARLPLDDDVTAGRAPFETHAAARAWLDLEWPNLIAWFHEMAVDSPRQAWLLADTLRGYFWLSCLNVEWLDVAQAAVALADAAGDLPAQAAGNLSLGNAYVNQNDITRSIHYYAVAAAASEAAQWPVGQASALNNLAVLHWMRGELDAMERRLLEALALNRQTGRRLGQARNLAQLAQLAAERGQLVEALERATEALDIDVELGSVIGQVKDRLAIGLVRHLLGYPAQGEAQLNQALADAQVLGESRGEVEILVALGLIAVELDRLDEAARHAAAALEIANEVGDPHGDGPVLNLFALIDRRAGRPAEAEPFLLRAVEAGEESGDRYPKAMALVELGRVRLDLGQPEAALAAATSGYEIAQEIGYRVIEADALVVLAAIHANGGCREEAERSARASLAICREAGHAWGTVRALLALAEVSPDGTALRAEADEIARAALADRPQ